MPIHYIVIRYPQQIVQMAFCDLSHTVHKQVTNVSQHVFVILLWRILTSQFKNKGIWIYTWPFMELRVAETPRL